MPKCQAIVIQKPGEAIPQEVDRPKLRDDYLLIKVKAVALNPTDWKHIDFVATKGTRVGCDYSGVVEEVGSKVTKPFKKGDRVCGFAHGGNVVWQEDGAFAEYITAKGDIQIKTPDNLSDEEASTLGVGVTTVGQSLYQSLKLPLPNKPTSEKIILLIYGGSTATGSLAIQYAKLSGLTVVVTCSPRNFDYVKSLGADAAFDYKSPTCAKDIREWSSNSIAYALDCIAIDTSPEITVNAMSPSGGVYTSLLSVPPETINKVNPKVEVKSTLGYTVIGESFKYRTIDIPAKPEDFEFGKMFWGLTRGLLEQGKIKVHRPSVNKYGKGFDGIVKGLDAMRHDKVSGEKLVFTL